MGGGHGEVSTDPRAPRAIDAAIAPGAMLGGRYRMDQRIGTGGMGSVWRVHDGLTGEAVALKVLPPQAGAEALARFRREVSLARRIAHPSVCRVFDLGDPDGLHILTMELIEGESLRARLARGSLPWDEARRLIDDLLAGLAAVHAAGVVHRDIKPENIVITSDGRAVIVDFGLAWAPTTEAVTAPEVGTPQYMAPEQLSGEMVDARSDVFVAGIAIQEIIDGRPPFEGATPALVSSAILRDAPRRLEGAEVPATARAALLQVVSRALGRDRTTRQANAGELRRDWLAALEGVVPRRRRPRGVTIGIGGGALVLVGVIAGLAIFMGVRSGKSPVEPPVESPAQVIARPAPFVIVPPWQPGVSHKILQAYATAEHKNKHSDTYSNDYYALDFDLALGEPVYPIADGTVLYAGPTTGGWAGYGNIVLLDHAVGGVSYQSLYAHLSSVDVPSRPGSAVSTSMMIGRAGKTGASQVELHLAIYRGASLANDSEGTGPYGGVAIIPEPFASCAKNGDACESLAAGDVLAKLPSPPSLP